MAQKDFHHPFEPYDIQQQFMEALYDCIEDGGVGIFESPTGTGKSLSLICGSLTWLREHKRRNFDEAIAKIDIGDGEPEWMLEHAKESRASEIRQMRNDFEARLSRVRAREARVRQQLADNEPAQKRRKDVERKDADDEEEQFVLDDYDSDAESTSRKRSEYSTETATLLEKLGMLPPDGRKPDKDDDTEELKIYFCSRTHSQLSQFTGELQRIRLPPGLPPESDVSTRAIEHVKHVTLGSRKNLCINVNVSKLPTQTAVNERCIELQQSKSSSAAKCAFLPKKDNEDIVLDFRDHALAKIRDIEDLASLGKRLQICPYYASRPAISAAEIVTLPYPLLLQRSAREALGISLKGHVVVIDEAHNLLDAIEGILSVKISEKQLKRVKGAIIVYLQKFRNRLKGSNRIYVTQLVRVLDSLMQFCASAKSGNKRSITTPSELLGGKGVDQVNLSKLVMYINESKLARKVEGYAAYIANPAMGDSRPTQAAKDAPEAEVPTLMHVQSFLIALTNPAKEGQFLWSEEDGCVVVQYMLLDPSEHFRDIVEDARAVVLAGGTMSPMQDYEDQLFPYLPAIRKFSCGHLIPTSSLLVRTIASDEHGRLDFSYKFRNKHNAIRIGMALQQIAKHVQGGLIVFFPSYGYLEDVLRAWKEDTVMATLEQLRPVFSDGRTRQAEDVFRAYSETISNKGSAIILSVIGGKLSEGINFADDLGRCVVVVGLPYPNLQTPGWRAKVEYLDKKTTSHSSARGQAGREHAENVCMRSVNQAIGRVIRHKNDWASILLLDARYGDNRIQTKLPGWIRNATNAEDTKDLGVIVRELEVFFQGKATRNP